MSSTNDQFNSLCLPKVAVIAPVRLSGLPAHPLVSIVVPSFNQGRYIRATLDSILSQDYRPLQIIVIDGASKDDTVDVLRSLTGHPELEWVSEPDRGVVEAVNKGFARVRGEIVAIQSSDDCYLPGTLHRVVQAFREHAAAGLIYGDSIKVDETGRELSRVLTEPFTLENWFRLRTWIPQPSAFFRRELLEVLGGWSDEVPYAADTDLWLRMAFRTQVLKLPEFLSQRRMHGAQRDVHADRIARDYTRMIDRSPEVAQAPAGIRRLAHASKYLMRVRYNAAGTDWAAGWNLLRAALNAPETLDLHGLIRNFAFQPLRRIGSRIKRRLLGSRVLPTPGVHR